MTSQTLTNTRHVTVRPVFCDCRALLLIIATGSLEKYMSLLVVVVVLVLLLVQVPKRNYILRHKNSQKLTKTQERHSASWAPCATRTSFEYCNLIFRKKCHYVS